MRREAAEMIASPSRYRRVPKIICLWAAISRDLASVESAVCDLWGKRIWGSPPLRSRTGLPRSPLLARFRAAIRKLARSVNTSALSRAMHQGSRSSPRYRVSPRLFGQGIPRSFVIYSSAIPSAYSSRGTCIGSTQAARIAGTSEATTATTSTMRRTATKVVTSDGDTP